ncbi:B-cell receptor-associated protein, putative [Entamoeba dispar SAW760]|uniref:Endoplasmic reticulum transmembrane protein n=1 Tax=Entamoeba dispar (strain ATCC PRA-260 / SAW760) TaxID=370354 RepID=B0EKF1_ENTDS|nr:B-cell receptor-associated protein, putative [Entamoeba dispar SAW760]EDR24989.1 B-cell receptor-associated protein, putative [Entamoeba dispar SAW760]|eukprot:EDR24989.1 B-cell receptor-associated protein, putative [Entamoeba dispar SAW760]
MATLLWSSVYFFLIAEIIMLIILLFPLPPFIARKIPFFLRHVLKNKTLFIVVLSILTLCFTESIRSQIKCSRELDELGTDDPLLNKVTISLNKFRSERNMYLSGFSLFFIFVIWRVGVLYQQIDQKAEKEKSSKVESKETKPVEETERPKTD